jgi:hypothetical protein
MRGVCNSGVYNIIIGTLLYPIHFQPGLAHVNSAVNNKLGLYDGHSMSVWLHAVVILRHHSGLPARLGTFGKLCIFVASYVLQVRQMY